MGGTEAAVKRESQRFHSPLSARQITRAQSFLAAHSNVRYQTYVFIDTSGDDETPRSKPCAEYR